ncbi:hypothetical protein LR48_Vigan05g193100 [Vigna angularis]|uniref:DUF3527 domain-containing protein n=1 Tax=Phaseolus angularis TaxID=3914 RepID=A0A0L9UNN2_PHAAN|nr:uncharacterized protein LOC108334487 [Vigna angularis]KAG2371284.1 uncharacterized protein HKW66_Vig0214580 [Vigna angularis]KOM44326.1 hypothetical protein LR48_Vigan05g193100 [Vigna angularis]
MNRKTNDRLKQEKTLSYADFHHEITKTEEDAHSLKPYRNQQKQSAYKMGSEEDELVRYMSNLPGYLEKGEKIPEKVLNVGVLDWASLKQWQYSHKQVPLSSRSSTSTSNRPSSVSIEGLSGNSSKGLSCSPSHQRLSRPSLQSHFMTTPMKGYPVSVKSSQGSFGNCQNLKGGSINVDTHSEYAGVGGHLSQNHTANIPKGCERRQRNPLIIKESDIFPNGGTYEAASRTKLEMSAQDDGPEKKVENFRQPNTNAAEHDMHGKSKSIVLILPRDTPQNKHRKVPDIQSSLCKKLASSAQTRLSEIPKELPCRYPNSNISYTCSQPDKISGGHSQPKRSVSSSTEPEDIKIPASTLSAPELFRAGISPSRSRKAEEKKHNTGASSSSNGPLKGIDQKGTAEKSRSSSPFRRFSFSIGFTGKGPGCKEVAHVPHQGSVAALKSSSENARGYASSKNSGNDKPGDASKSRSSSPLRRLLDPLLKPKTGHRSMELTDKDSVLTKKNCRPGDGEISMEKKDVVRGQRVGCTNISAVDLSKNKKNRPSTFQALLRIAVKNGQPLFTFAVDNNSNIIAATVKNLAVSEEDECDRIYTFFTFREGKKKSGSWMNQASKTKGPDYIHHAVAQMKVSGSQHYASPRQNCVDSNSNKEFVLFSVKLKQGDAQVTDYEPKDELAAIVVKSPKAIDFINYAHQSSRQNDTQDLHVTVVLPTGVHSLPSNGGPSSLIERWRTGGSCDCGGWDMACKLKILANESDTYRESRISKACFPHPFELFLQGNDQDQENQPAFSFSPFKPGVYSVAFDSSFSLLQAFSICIALVDGLISYELSGSRNYIEGKNSRETGLVETDELKAFGKLEDVPATYVAYPPHSPVGRV